MQKKITEEMIRYSILAGAWDVRLSVRKLCDKGEKVGAYKIMCHIDDFLVLVDIYCVFKYATLSIPI